MSLDLCLSGVEPWLDSGRAFLLETPGSDPVSFWVHRIRGCVMSVCPMAGDVNFGLLFQGYLPGFWRCPRCGCFAGWLLWGQGPGRIYVSLSCWHVSSLAVFWIPTSWLFPFQHAVSRECLPSPFYLVFPQIVAVPGLPPGVWMYFFFFIIINFLKFIFWLKCSWIIVLLYNRATQICTYIYVLFHILFHYGLSQNIENSSQC